MNLRIILDKLKLTRMVGTLTEISVMPDIPPMLEKVGKRMEEVAREKAEPHPGTDSGELALSIEFELSDSWHGDLWVGDPGAEAAEYGRQPGAQPPPIDAITDWIDAHLGGDASPFVIARSIGINGTEGLHFMQAAYEYGASILGEEVEDVAQKIEIRWSRV